MRSKTDIKVSIGILSANQAYEGFLQNNIEVQRVTLIDKNNKVIEISPDNISRSVTEIKNIASGYQFFNIDIEVSNVGVFNQMILSFTVCYSNNEIIAEIVDDKVSVDVSKEFDDDYTITSVSMYKKMQLSVITHVVE